MRAYIFTESERKVLHKWLSGTLRREDSALLHTTLGRLRRNESIIIDELRFFTLVVRRLRLSPTLRAREGDMDTSLAIHIPIHIPKTRLLSYIKLVQLLSRAQEIANDDSIDTEHRLSAAKMAAEMGMAMIGAGEEKHGKLEEALEKLREKLPKKIDPSTSTP